MLIFNGCLLASFVTYYLRQKKWSGEGLQYNLINNIGADPVAVGETRKPGQSSDYSIIMNRYGFRNAADTVNMRINTTNPLYEALIDESAAMLEMDSKIGVHAVDYSAFDQSRIGIGGARRFGIGQNGNISLGIAAPLFLPNDMSII